jgi:hypothetical protein
MIIIVIPEDRQLVFHLATQKPLTSPPKPTLQIPDTFSRSISILFGRCKQSLLLDHETDRSVAIYSSKNELTWNQ